MDEMIINIFDMATLEIVNGLAAPIILVIGDDEIERTSLIRDITNRHRDIPYIRLFSEEDSNNRNYCDILPETSIYDGYIADFVNNAFRNYRNISRRAIDDKVLPIDVDKRSLLLFDGCFTCDSPMDRTLLNLFCNGVCWAVSVVIATSSPLKCLINYSKYIFIFKQKDEESKRIIFEKYDIPVSFDRFSTLLNSLSEKCDCLVIHKDKITHNNIISLYTVSEQDIIIRPTSVQKTKIVVGVSRGTQTSEDCVQI
jgi:hypothetical protein